MSIRNKCLEIAELIGETENSLYERTEKLKSSIGKGITELNNSIKVFEETIAISQKAITNTNDFEERKKAFRYYAEKEKKKENDTVSNLLISISKVRSNK